MNKNTCAAVILAILLFTSTLFSGCLEKNDNYENQSNAGSLPTAQISAKDEAYFGELIEFDASGSRDSDGQIVSYTWDFGDGQNAQGAKVSHLYAFENNFNLEYPLIYPVTLVIEDNAGNAIAATHQIKVFPQEYMFYLDYNLLTAEKPSSNEEKISSNSYAFKSPVLIEKCSWSAAISLEKPLFATIKRVSITFYDPDGNQLDKEEKNFGMSAVWKEKSVEFSGEFGEEIEISYIKIEIQSFSIISRISIIYGGEKASFVRFNFVR